MSGYIPYQNDPMTLAYLDSIRKQNKAYMSKCYYCGVSSIGIVAEGYLLYPACKTHMTIYESIQTNKEILDRLGSDYDENGIPYWEKYS